MVDTNNSFVSDYSPKPWWLLLGDAVFGELLLLGDIDTESLRFLQQLAKNIVFNPSSDQLIQQKFDAIISQNYLSAVELNALSEKYLDCLKPNGSIILLEANTLSLKQLFNAPFAVFFNLFRFIRRQQLERTFPHNLIHWLPSTSYSGEVYESFVHNYYYSNKNTFLLKEKIRRKLFNSPFCRLFNSNHIWLIRNQQSKPGLVESVKNAIKIQFSINSELQWTGVYYKFGKLIFSFLDQDYSDCRYVAVLAFSNAAVVQRNNERHTINTLLADEKTRHMVNGEVKYCLLHGFSTYIMRQGEGLTVDVAHEAIAEMTTNAYHALVALGKAMCTYDVDAQQQKIHRWIEHLNQRSPGYEESIAKIESFIISNLQQFRLPSVINHGDAKLENFLLTPEYRVASIIDWELSQADGFPLLDLLYLIDYNLEVKQGCEFGQAFCQILDNQLSEQDSELLADYCHQFNINQDERKLLMLIFFLHHFGERFHIEPNKTRSVNSFRLSLKRVMQEIEPAQELHL